MVEAKPAFIGFNGAGTGAYFLALPCTGSAKHVAMLAPVGQILTAGAEDIAKGGVARVGRTGQHHVFAVDLAGEQNTVAVVGQENVFHLVEGFKVFRPADTDGRTMVAVAPGDIVLAIQIAHAGIIAVFAAGDFGIAFELDGLGGDIPVDTVLGEAHVDVHVNVLVIAAEHAGKAILKGHYGAVENAVGDRGVMTADNGVIGITPYGILTSFGFVLPRDIGQSGADELAHGINLLECVVFDCCIYFILFSQQLQYIDFLHLF